MEENNQQKEQSTKVAKNGKFTYSVASAAVLAIAAAIVLTVLAVSGVFTPAVPVDTTKNSTSPTQSSTLPDSGSSVTIDQPTVEEPTLDVRPYVEPLDEVVLLTGYGFYYNPTLNCYYEHKGVDITAEVGDKVYALADGEVTSIYSADVLCGVEVTIDHGNGVKTVYGYVDPLETLKVGDKVTKGMQFGTVATASGAEYKNGTHLHLEMFVNDSSVDPTEYLTLTEK